MNSHLVFRVNSFNKQMMQVHIITENQHLYTGDIMEAMSLASVVLLDHGVPQWMKEGGPGCNYTDHQSTQIHARCDMT